MSWAIVIGAGVGLAGSAMSVDAAKSAAGSQVGASQEAIHAQQQSLADQKAALSPFAAVGTGANRTLATLLGIGGIPGGHSDTSLGFNDPIWKSYVAGGGYAPGATGAPANADAADNTTDQTARRQIYAQQGLGIDSSDPTYGALTKPITMADVAADPSYSNGLQFGLDNGNKGINQAAIGNGTYDSGATLKALTQFGNDYGTTKTQGAINNIFSNRGQQYGFLSGQQGVGMNAVTGQNLATSNTANNVGQLTTGIGNANAASTIAGANAFSGAGSNISSAYSNANSQANQQSILQQILAQGINKQPVFSNGSTDYSNSGVMPGST